MISLELLSSANYLVVTRCARRAFAYALGLQNFECSLISTPALSPSGYFSSPLRSFVVFREYSHIILYDVFR